MPNKPIFQARASLIDRLTDLHPESKQEIQPLRTLNRRNLKASLRRDLSWLLNTRTPIPASVFDDKKLTVLDYGIPDFGSYGTANLDDQTLLVKRITKAISAFEPRLRNVRIDVGPKTNEKTLYMAINALMIVESVREPVFFQTVFQKQTNEWNVNDS
ncbi:MAG: type VI secretion system baseplate subunit TssE [Desulfobacteraceae bacterium]|nr:type VI secretion system baseplate subunit TssE [Desulfobacteraceae bacterium]